MTALKDRVIQVQHIDNQPILLEVCGENSRTVGGIVCVAAAAAMEVIEGSGVDVGWCNQQDPADRCWKQTVDRVARIDLRQR